MVLSIESRSPYETAHPEVWPALEKLVDPVTRGDPESPLRWTCKLPRRGWTRSPRQK